MKKLLLILMLVSMVSAQTVVFRQSTDTLKLVCSAENATSYQWNYGNGTDSVLTIIADSTFYSTTHKINCTVSNGIVNKTYGDWTIKNRQVAFRRKY